MKRASYKHGIELIALNDEPLEEELEIVQGFISVGIVADLFGVPTEKVARDVLRYREKHGELNTKTPDLLDEP